MKFNVEFDVDYAWYRCDEDSKLIDLRMVAQTLRKIADAVDGGTIDGNHEWGCFIRDGNGNKVGKWCFKKDGR